VLQFGLSQFGFVSEEALLYLFRFGGASFFVNLFVIRPSFFFDHLTVEALLLLRVIARHAQQKKEASKSEANKHANDIAYEFSVAHFEPLLLIAHTNRLAALYINFA